MSIVPCKEDDCQRKVQSRGMCITHYSRWYRKNTQHQLTCGHCGAIFTHNRKDRATCSNACHISFTLTTEGYKGRAIVPPPVKLAAPKKPKKTDAELSAHWKAQRSPLRAAYEDQDWPALIAAIKTDSKPTSQGCWEWQRKTRDGYPIIKMGRKFYQAHRIALEAKHGKPLGVLAAHHSCANSLCVNPDHLQPVTHRENVAEMLARTSLEARIAELEGALSSIAPHHPVLNRIGHLVA